jgi:hypothetical protein
MGTIWVLVVLGALGLGVAVFEGGVMKSPGAGLSVFHLVDGALDAILSAAFHALCRLF